MIDLERIKTPILIFMVVMVSLVILSHFGWIDKSMFFDEKGKIKKYGLASEASPFPLKGVVVMLAIVITVMTYTKEQIREV